jgi:hypothetical protein
VKVTAKFEGGPIGGKVYALNDPGMYWRVPVSPPSPYIGSDAFSVSETPFREEVYRAEPWTSRQLGPDHVEMVYRWQDPNQALREELARAQKLIKLLENASDEERKLRDAIAVIKRILVAP